jgi:hypothetical protein
LLLCHRSARESESIMAGTLIGTVAKSLAGSGSQIEQSVNRLPDLPTNVGGFERRKPVQSIRTTRT